MHFKDLESPLTALFTEDYFWIKKINWKTPTVNNINTFGYLYSNRSMSTIGSISLSYVNPTGGIAIQNLRMKTDGRLLAELSAAVTPYVKLNACIEDGRQEPGKPVHSFGKIGLDYEKKDMSLSADVDIINGPSIQGCALLNFYNRLNLGGEFLCNTHFDEKEKAEIIDCNVGMSFNATDTSLSVRTADLFDIFRFGYVQRNVAALDLDLGVRVDYRIRNHHQRLTVGGKWRPNEITELKAKVDSDLVLSTSFSQHILPFMRMTICTLVDVKQEVVLDGYLFGIGFDFNF